METMMMNLMRGGYGPYDDETKDSDCTAYSLECGYCGHCDY